MRKRISIVLGVLILIISWGVYLYPVLLEMQLDHNADQTSEYPFFTDESGESFTGLSGKEEGETQPSYKDNKIGSICIPDMDVTLPLFLGASQENLKKGAAVLSQSSMPVGGQNTNCVIAGHRGYRGLPYFRDIELLSPGSLVYITNPQETLTYTVTEIKIIDPSDTASIGIQEGKDMITLLTCHPYMSHGKYRYLVFCERTDTSRTDAAPATQALPKHCRTLLGTGVDADQLEQDTKQGHCMLYLEKGLRMALPVIGGLILVTQIASREKERRTHDDTSIKKTKN